MFSRHDSIGLHLIIMPEASARIPTSAQAQLTAAIEHAARLVHFGVKACNVQADHAHILVSATTEDDVPAFINTVLDATHEVIIAQGGPYRSFTWSPAVHVTLLPPWHIEILASFVRDQDHYHETRTLEDELNEVFRPNAIPETSEHLVN